MQTIEKKPNTGASLHLYECNGWMIPNKMNWDDFVEMRVSLGFNVPQPRKAKYLTDTSVNIGLGKVKGHSEYSWRGTPDYFRPLSNTKNSPNARLSENDVKEIWALLKKGESQVSIGLRYKVSNVTISRIAKKETWSEVTNKL